MDHPNFSVLMSLYEKENPQFLSECLESLVTQTVLPSEIVIVLDGPISKQLEVVVDFYVGRYEGLFKVVSFAKNRGLGPALADGVLACANSLIARMDTDDIARSDRFELQLREFEENADLDICGSHILEFEGAPSNVIAKRCVPVAHEEIAQYQKKRSAFNHMTVMYRKEAVLRAGNYEDCPLMEDDLLWVRMLAAGANCANVDDCLVFARTGRAMIGRRGGWDYFKKYRRARKKILESGYISFFDYGETVLAQFLVALAPLAVRSIIFSKVLR